MNLSEHETFPFCRNKKRNQRWQQFKLDEERRKKEKEKEEEEEEDMEDDDDQGILYVFVKPQILIHRDVGK